MPEQMKLLRTIVKAMFFIMVSAGNMNAYANTLSDSIPSRVLILGNSITWHGAKPAIGWSGNWGMAASAAEKDFVHLLKSNIKTMSPQTIFQSANIANTFERKFWKYNVGDFRKFVDWNPELIVLEIGENINDTLAVKYRLGEHLDRFIGELSGDRKPTICLVGSFWPNQHIDKIMKAACVRHNWIYVDLQGLYKEREINTAIQQYQNQGVGMHPSDIGMENIAKRIWNEIQHLFK